MMYKINLSRICFYHWQHLNLGFVNILHTPLASLMIVLCMTCALFLAIFSCELLENLRGIRTSLNKSAEIVLYLKKQVTSQAVGDLASQLRTNPLLAQIAVVAPDAGLKYFADNPELYKAVAELKVNPLPYVITLYPRVNVLSPPHIQTLTRQLENYPEVAVVRADHVWLEQSYHFLNLAHTAVILLVLILGVNALLILCGISYLVTKIFVVKRTLIHHACAYQAAWYGCFSSFLAIFLLRVLVIILQKYGIQLSMLSSGCEIFVLLSSIVLTFTSARLVSSA